MDLSEALTLVDLEQAARSAVDPAIWAYIAGGAGMETTVRANVAAFDAVWLRPRVLGPSCVTPSTAAEILGRTLSMPVLLAPTSPHRLLHEDAELATAREAAA